MSINFRCHGGGKRAAAAGSSKDERERAQEKLRETERKFTLIKIEEGAKKFVATNVDDDVKGLSAKLKHFTESELGNLLKTEMEKLTPLELTTLKEVYINTRHIDKRMDLIMFSLLPEANAIKDKIDILKEILETTKLTLSQI